MTKRQYEVKLKNIRMNGLYNEFIELTDSYLTEHGVKFEDYTTKELSRQFIKKHWRRHSRLDDMFKEIDELIQNHSNPILYSIKMHDGSYLKVDVGISIPKTEYKEYQYVSISSLRDKPIEYW